MPVLPLAEHTGRSSGVMSTGTQPCLVLMTAHKCTFFAVCYAVQNMVSNRQESLQSIINTQLPFAGLWEPFSPR